MSDHIYAQYELYSEALCIGERTKKGTFKPCVKTIPFSSITGALKEVSNVPDIVAAGKFDADYLGNIDKFTHVHIFSPRNIFEEVAKVPLRIEFISGVRGMIYIMLNSDAIRQFVDSNKIGEININMGAFRSKGFGTCRLRFVNILETPKNIMGKLQTRLPEKQLKNFGINKVIKPIYGYLFEPQNIATGKYVRAVFENSIVEGYDFLCQEDKK